MYFYNKIKKEKLKSGYYKYCLLNGDEKYLTGWDLDNTSLVLDLGGYTGVFSDRIIRRFDCNVYIYEPVAAYYKGLVKKYEHNNKVNIYNFGFSNINTDAVINCDGEASSIIKKSNSPTELIRLLNISEYLLKNPMEIDLMSINIEGSEYDVLNSLVDSKLIQQVKYLQIQFHFFNDQFYINKREEVLKNILNTHNVKFSFPFVWEGFERKITV